MSNVPTFAAVLEAALAGGAAVRFRAEGTSMYPTIRDGELITVGPVAADAVCRGDVLLVCHRGRLLAHRVVGITVDRRNQVLELQGDAKGGCDTPIDASAVVAKVINVDRHGRAIALCGRGARTRHAARALASRAKASIARQVAVHFPAAVPVTDLGVSSGTPS